MPELSIVVPAYRSQATIAASLEALLAQRGDFEIVVVDSSPDELTWEAIAPFRGVIQAQRSAHRLLPHAARNVGVSMSQGRRLVFTDPDVIARPDWLEQLAHAAAATPGSAIAGAINCCGDSRLERGVHLAKFGPWLPGPPRRIDNAPTANLLVPGELFTELGGFEGENLHGDAVLTRRLHRRGALVFEPRAIVDHDHGGTTLGTALRERLARGRLWGEVRLHGHHHARLRVAGLLVATVLPIRLARISWLMARRATSAGWLARLPAVLPVAIACQAAALAGEALAYTNWLVRSTPLAGGAKPASLSERLD